MSTMIQKVIQIGSSVGVTIPKQLAQRLGLTVGRQVEVIVDEKQGSVTYRAADRSLDKTELRDWNKKFIKRYKKALDALADK
jgi:antitoxin component of MazEF toxin-antitoxin module